jgi:hypothetical protein
MPASQKSKLRASWAIIASICMMPQVSEICVHTCMCVLDVRKNVNASIRMPMFTLSISAVAHAHMSCARLAFL